MDLADISDELSLVRDRKAGTNHRESRSNDLNVLRSKHDFSYVYMCKFLQSDLNLD